MGSPPAPPLSNIWLLKYKPSIKDDAEFFDCYIDDIVITIKVDLIDRTNWLA